MKLFPNRRVFPTMITINDDSPIVSAKTSVKAGCMPTRTGTFALCYQDSNVEIIKFARLHADKKADKQCLNPMTN